MQWLTGKATSGQRRRASSLSGWQRWRGACPTGGRCPPETSFQHCVGGGKHRAPHYPQALTSSKPEAASRSKVAPNRSAHREGARGPAVPSGPRSRGGLQLRAGSSPALRERRGWQGGWRPLQPGSELQSGARCGRAERARPAGWQPQVTISLSPFPGQGQRALNHEGDKAAPLGKGEDAAARLGSPQGQPLSRVLRGPVEHGARKYLLAG